ncbi:MAG TPA: energy-coupling factor transporter transmembrane component T [Solirubrobacteraceae bacterium]|jgi:energy-coupling factor transport system permease protein|nr:energy-coupling factor transporter transmembrane component T [Solirubrobacteraceae bacterium]
MIGSLMFYRRLASPLHAARASVGALWALSLTAASLILYHPLALLALLLAVLGAGVGAGVGARIARSLRMAAIVALPIVLVNVLVSRQGLSVFARLGDLGPFGQGDLTLEALVYGGVIALKVTLLILITGLAGLAIDPDELLRIFRRLSFRSALTATLATRMLPVLAADSQRLAEAQRTRPGGAPGGARGRVALLGAVVAGSLDRAMDVAATLEVRGFAAPRRTPRGHESAVSATHRTGGVSRLRGAAHPRGSLRRALSRHDIAFAVSALAVLALALAGRLTGVASFDAYPQIELRFDAGTLALCAALLAAVLLPFCDRRGIER